MDVLHLTTLAMVCAFLAAFVTGFSKAGIPGTGILVVPLMASAFGGRLAVGATVPILILGDCIAVYFYRSDCDWSQLKKIAPSVVAGICIGALFLALLPQGSSSTALMSRLIGAFVLVMLGFQLLRERLKERLVPTSPTGTILTGLTAGFSTMVSNAAGPIMSIFLTATGLPRNRFMGTAAWYFLIFNTLKLPFLYVLSLQDPSHPFINLALVKGEIVLVPAVVAGSFVGRKLLPIVSEKTFSGVVLFLAGAAAAKLLLS